MDATAVEITAFLTARSVYEADDSTEKRLAKGEAKEGAVSAGEVHGTRLRSSFFIAKSDLKAGCGFEGAKNVVNFSSYVKCQINFFEKYCKK